MRLYVLCSVTRISHALFHTCFWLDGEGGYLYVVVFVHILSESIVKQFKKTLIEVFAQRL